MRYGPFIILLLLLTTIGKPVSAQQLIFKNYTVNDGLIANSIRRVFQDSKGFLWIATWEGLSKYDGYRFTNFSTANGLSHNVVNDLYESPDGRVYAATNDRSIDLINENKVLQKAVSTTTTINRFFQLPGNRVIAATDNEGLLEFKNGNFTTLRKDPHLSGYFDFTVLNDSFFIVVTGNSIQLLNRKYELLSAINDPNPVYTEYKIYQDSKKRILVGTETGLQLLAGIPGKGQPLLFIAAPPPFNIPALQGKKITDILEDAEKVTWIGTTSGLFKIYPDGSNQLITKKDGLASDFITTIFQDREKNIWFGTSLGLSKLVTQSNIVMYTTGNGLLSNNVLFLQPAGQDHFLVSTNKGAQVFNSVNGKFSSVASIVAPPLYSVVRNSHPLLVIGVNKMAVFDSVALQFRNSIPFPATFPPFCIINDKEGNFFLSDQEHLYLISEKKEQKVKILDNFFSVLLIDKNGDLWAATFQKGLYHIRYSFSNNKLTILANEHFLPDENIRSLFEDSKGNIWAGTRYHGVYRFSKNGATAYTISNIDQSKGLLSNWIKALAETANGDLWIASYQGLDKLIPQDSSYRVFNFSRVNNYFGSINGMVPGRDHSLWLATGEGMVHITDGEMEKLPPLPVYITKISAPDTVYALHTGKLNLSYGHNQLQFEFSCPGFINEKQLLYSYHLSGSADTKWTEASNQHSVSYASLQPGNYRFEVRTMGWDGNWGEPAAFDFNIQPPFWQTGRFLLLCSLLFFAGIYLAVRKRVQVVRKKAALKQKIAEIEMMALQAQMNPHFIFNCINSIDAYIHSNDKYNATLYLNKFAKLLRNILDNSKQNTVAFTKDVETLKLYVELEELRHENKFKTTISIDEELLNSDYKVPPLIIQPFVENAILHGLKNRDDNNGLLHIEIRKAGDKILYNITDNGIGRDAAKQIMQNKESHYGMQMSYDRIKIFNKEQQPAVTVTDLKKDGIATGTRIEVLLKTV